MKNELVRHILATIKYRLKKALTHYEHTFDDFSLGHGSRTIFAIMVHMQDVLRWAINQTVEADQRWTKHEVQDGSEALQLFLKSIDYFDNMLAREELELAHAKKLLQGPLSDILTHIGQLAMMSRLNGRPIDGEDFSAAGIEVGDGEP